jgi:hypothetical protein
MRGDVRASTGRDRLRLCESVTLQEAPVGDEMLGPEHGAKQHADFRREGAPVSIYRSN